MYSDGTFPFEKTNSVGYAKLWGNRDYHMDMIWADVTLNDFSSFLFCELAEYCSNLFFYSSEEYFFSVLRDNNHMVYTIPSDMILFIKDVIGIHLFGVKEKSPSKNAFLAEEYRKKGSVER